jgi:hypothetical protein
MSLIGRDPVVHKRASAAAQSAGNTLEQDLHNERFRNMTNVFQCDESSRTISGRMAKKGQMRFGARDGD